MEDLNLDIAGAIEDIRTALAGGALGLITNLPWKEADPSFPRLSSDERGRMLVWVGAYHDRAQVAFDAQNWMELGRLSQELAEQLQACKLAGNHSIETDALSHTIGSIAANVAYLLDACRASSEA